MIKLLGGAGLQAGIQHVMKNGFGRWGKEMKKLCALLILLLAPAAFAQQQSQVTGWVIDSACAYTKNLAKPISPVCARGCAKKGSPLVLLSDSKDKTIYLPIDSATPAAGQNDKLLPYAGERVTVSGSVYQRGSSKAIVIDKIEAAK
jgi:hypothetical protein